MRLINLKRFLLVSSILMLLIISLSLVSASDFTNDTIISSNTPSIDSDMDAICINETNSLNDIGDTKIDTSNEKQILYDFGDSVEEDIGEYSLTDEDRVKYINDIRNSNSDLYDSFFNHLINECGFELRNTSDVGDGYLLYATRTYHGTYFDGEKFDILPNQYYFVSTNDRDSYIINNIYFEDIIYSHNDNYYLDEEYLGWIMDNFNFIFDQINSRTINEINSSTKAIQNSIRYNLPSRYDLRQEGYVTPVKNQGNTGNCWAFAAMSALESFLLKNEGVSYNFTANLDLSENHLKNIMSSTGRNGIEIKVNEATKNLFISLSYFLRWSGPINEVDDSYGSTNNSLESNPVKHVQGIKFIKPRANALDLEEIKQSIYQYGGLVTSLYWNNAFLNYNNKVAYNYPGRYSDVENSTWHAITLVGWDDNYPASNFLYHTGENMPNGAFIVKNSYGTSNGEKGYYYISYYDNSLAYRSTNGFSGFVFTEVEDINNFGSNYNYNPLGLVAWGKNNNYVNNISYANQWVANKNDSLEACGIYTKYPSKYSINVLINNNSVMTKSLFLNYAGFHTIPFDSPILVNEGQVFRIEVTLENNNFNDNYIFPIECSISNYSNVNSSLNQSFIKVYDNNIFKWVDTSRFWPNGKVCLHVFSKSVCGSITTKVLSNDLDMPYNSNSLNATLFDNVGMPLANKKLVFNFYKTNGQIKDYNTTTDAYGRAKINIHLKPGFYRFVISFYGDNEYNTSSRVVKVKVNKMPTTVTSINSCYHGDYFTATLKDKFGNAITNKKIRISIANHNYYKTTDSSGKVSLQINLKNNTFKVVSKFAGDACYLGSSKTVNLKVYRAPSKFVVNNYNGNYNSSKVLNVKLLNTKTNKGISNKVISFKIYTGSNYKIYNRTTNSEGVASFDPSRMGVGNHNTIVFSPNNNLMASNVNINIKINKAPTIVNAPNVRYKVNTQNYLKVTVRHKDTNNLLVGIRLTIKAYTGNNYNTYTIITKENGVATFNTKVLAVGTHKIEITSANNNYIINATSTVTITN